MYGDKTQAERLDIIGPKGQTIPNAKVNIEYYITKEQFTNLYYTEKLKYKDIAELVKFPYDLTVLSRSFRKIGWKKELGRTKYNSDSTLFEKFDRESAWLYGWIITDGHVHDKYVDLTLQKNDEDILYKFKDIAKFDGVFYYAPNSTSIRLYNKNIVKHLRKQGIPKHNKTFDCVFPTIPKEYMWDFIRGAFEGDGCITGKEKGGISVSMCGASKSLMYSISDFLTSQGVENYIREPRKNFYVVKARGMASGLRWMYFMYVNTSDNVRMRRKFNYYTEVIRTFYNHKRYVPEAIELVELARQTIPECSDYINAQSTQKEAV